MNFYILAFLLLFTVSSRKEETNGLYAATPGADGAPSELLSGKGKYSKLTWDEDQTQLVFASDRDDAAAKQPKIKLYHWKRGEAKAADQDRQPKLGTSQADQTTKYAD